MNGPPQGVPGREQLLVACAVRTGKRDPRPSARPSWRPVSRHRTGPPSRRTRTRHACPRPVGPAIASRRRARCCSSRLPFPTPFLSIGVFTPYTNANGRNRHHVSRWRVSREGRVAGASVQVRTRRTQRSLSRLSSAPVRGYSLSGMHLRSDRLFGSASRMAGWARRRLRSRDRAVISGVACSSGSLIALHPAASRSRRWRRSYARRRWRHRPGRWHIAVARCRAVAAESSATRQQTL